MKQQRRQQDDRHAVAIPYTDFEGPDDRRATRSRTVATVQYTTHHSSDLLQKGIVLPNQPFDRIAKVLRSFLYFLIKVHIHGYGYYLRQ